MNGAGEKRKRGKKKTCPRRGRSPALAVLSTSIHREEGREEEEEEKFFPDLPTYSVSNITREHVTVQFREGGGRGKKERENTRSLFATIFPKCPPSRARADIRNSRKGGSSSGGGRKRTRRKEGEGKKDDYSSAESLSGWRLPLVFHLF